MHYREIFDIAKKKVEEQKVITLVLGVIIVAIIGILEYLSGYKLGFSIFYLLPICTVTWIISKKVGLILIWLPDWEGMNLLFYCRKPQAWQLLRQLPELKIS